METFCLTCLALLGPYILLIIVEKLWGIHTIIAIIIIVMYGFMCAAIWTNVLAYCETTLSFF